MIRTLLTTTALAVLMTAGAIAQDATPVDPSSTDAPATTEAPPAPAAPAPAEMEPAGQPSTGTPEAPAADVPAPVEAQPGAAAPPTFEMGAGYTRADSDNLASELIDQAVYSSSGDDAEEIGNVTDLVFDDQGMISAVVIGVGGFLGIGEKSVAVSFDALEFAIAADNTERWVLPTTAEALNSAPDFVWEEDEPAEQEAEGDAMAPADGTMAPADGTMAPADSTMAPAAN